ncbi:ABC transporter ATP-binding protein [Frigoribacterium sp. CFBP 13605]|uniref:ABC transporter ATP-binding protein n=1 Tax=Frigoribacterium sp. CFBP 13605 TaxID=2774034 RepID=UPI001908BC8E|nr:ABC transporter ATP-binding protein [Frigoribacterium sp. CFBP 13605]MBD8141040.1 ABC transporter ATP-binding protein [Frigoribacterium sp. CFBP 13605]
MSLVIDDLTVTVGGRRVVDGLSLDVPDGARVGLIGESGSGKSMTTLAVLGLLPDGARATGSIRLDGRELLGASERNLAGLRGRVVGTVFQDPRTALDPVVTVGRQIVEPLRLHGRVGRRDARSRAVAAAAEVGLPDPETVVDLYPHQLSGGQRQRVGIAMALINRPGLVLADEPTTALDVTTQAEVLALFQRLVDEQRTSLLFVTHDLAVLSRITDHAAVLSHGRVVERGPVEQLLHRPEHEVTRGLVEATRATTWRAS